MPVTDQSLTELAVKSLRDTHSGPVTERVIPPYVYDPLPTRKVYIVTEGAYDDFRVDSVWSSELSANLRKKEMIEGNPRKFWAKYAQVVEVELDKTIGYLDNASGVGLDDETEVY